MKYNIQNSEDLLANISAQLCIDAFDAQNKSKTDAKKTLEPISIQLNCSLEAKHILTRCQQDKNLDPATVLETLKKVQKETQPYANPNEKKQLETVVTLYTNLASNSTHLASYVKILPVATHAARYGSRLELDLKSQAPVKDSEETQNNLNKAR